MAEEEVLGEEEAQQEPEEEEGGFGGFPGLSGDIMDSSIVQLLLWAVGIVAVILVVVGVTYWTINTMYMETGPSEGNVSEEQPGVTRTGPLSTFNLENDFVLTKQDPRTGRTRTLKLHIYLAYNSENAAVKSELKKRKPQIRDLIYGVLGNMKVEELGYDNKQQIQDKLVSEINKILTSGNRIQDVYFSTYVFQ